MFPVQPKDSQMRFIYIRCSQDWEKNSLKKEKKLKNTGWNLDLVEKMENPYNQKMRAGAIGGIFFVSVLPKDAERTVPHVG